MATTRTAVLVQRLVCGRDVMAMLQPRWPSGMLRDGLAAAPRRDETTPRRSVVRVDGSGRTVRLGVMGRAGKLR